MTDEQKPSHTSICLDCLLVEGGTGDVHTHKEKPSYCGDCGSLRIAVYDHAIAGSPGTDFDDFWKNDLESRVMGLDDDEEIEKEVKTTVERFQLERWEVVEFMEKMLDY